MIGTCGETVGSKPVGLVGGDRLHPEGWPPVVIPAGNEMRRTVSVDERGDHVQEAADGIGGWLGRGVIARVGHAVEGPEVEAGRVQEHEPSGIRHVGILSGRGRPGGM